MKIKKIFFDANIFNDIFDDKRLNHKDSKNVLIFCIQNNIEIFTSCDIVTNIYYITAKYTTSKEALKALNYVKEIVNIIPFAKNELNLTIELMNIDNDYKDLEDTIQYILALENSCDLILTNDKKFTAKEIESSTAKRIIKLWNI